MRLREFLGLSLNLEGCLWVFTVKDYFILMEGDLSCAGPIKILWNPHVPSKIGFFCLGGLVGHKSLLDEEKRFPLS